MITPADVATVRRLVGAPGNATSPAGIRLRPVLPGRGGRWVTSGICWANLDYATYDHEAWLVDVDAGVIEVHTSPSAGGYQQVRIAGPGESVAVAGLGVVVDVGEVLR